MQYNTGVYNRATVTNSGTKIDKCTVVQRNMKKRYITFKSIDSLVTCCTHHQIIQYFSEVGILFTVKFRPPGSPFPTRRHLSIRITSFKHVNNSTDTYGTASETELLPLPVNGTLQL